ncbi:hypothetical protein ACS7SF_12520 [Ralstonia sp. 25C]|uniref:hypothetical protein n=1 Tax=Ralstonia sp. 25C TaxID=3447363 RepID=UPI003F74B9F5
MSRVHALIGSVLFCAALVCHAEGIPPDITGDWLVISTPTSANITAMSQSAANKLVGKTLSIRPKEIRFGQHKCAVESVTESTGNISKEIGTAYKMDSTDVILLGLPHNVRHIDARCFDFYVKPNRHGKHLIFNQDGFFFEAKKVSR